MKLSALTRSILALAILAAAQTASSIEVGLSGDTTNVHLPWSRQTPMTVDKLPTNYYFGGCEAWVAAPIGEDAAVRIAFDRDIVLRNTIIGTFQFDRGIARIQAGPIFGVGNSDSCPFSTGMTAALRLQWPGVAYVSVRSDGGTALTSFQAKAEPQAQAVLAAGFYVPYAIVSGIFTIKRFNELDDDDELVTDTLKRYEMTIDVFKKNVPYTAMLSMGYEQRTKSYDAYDESDGLGSIFLGVDASMEVQKGFRIQGGFSSSAYVFGTDEMRGRGPGSSAFMFGLNFGMILDTAKVQRQPRPSSEAAEAAAQERAPAEQSEEPAAERQEPEEPAKAEAEPAREENASDAAEQPAEEAANDAEEPEAEKPQFSRLALDIGGGYFYNDRLELEGDVGAVISFLANSRIGASAYAGYRFTPSLAIGLELGFDWLSVSSSAADLTLYDIPLRANFRYSLGVADIECFTGPFFNGIKSDGGTKVYTDYDAGLRLRLFGLFAEVSYVFGLSSQGTSVEGVGSIADNYLRMGIGYALKIK